MSWLLDGGLVAAHSDVGFLIPELGVPVNE